MKRKKKEVGKKKVISIENNTIRAIKEAEDNIKDYIEKGYNKMYFPFDLPINNDSFIEYFKCKGYKAFLSYSTICIKWE